jgi:hypothetical protein
MIIVCRSMIFQPILWLISSKLNMFKSIKILESLSQDVLGILPFPGEY